MKTNFGGFMKTNFKSVFVAPLKRFGSSLSLYEGSVESDYKAKPYKDDSSFVFNSRNSDLSGCCRSPIDRRSSPTGSIISTQSQSQLTPSRQLSDGERLRKVVVELIDTERTYVKHLNNLLQNYLEPLRNAPFLSSAEVSALFGNIQEIVAFQRLFLQALQEAVDMEPGFYNFEHPYEFKNVLFSIGSAFLYYASQFKLYSSFCASHSKAQKVLHPSEGNQALQEFLMSRNPRQQHSATLESYLIKPIQRILKYPLLLQQLKNLTESGSEEHRHLTDALKVMEKVAEHINEMQRIHEEYGAIFDHLFRQHQKSCKHPIDLSPGDLLYYGGVEWLNISDFLGKIKKGLELHAMCFVFKTAVVFLCKERLRQKKKLMGGSGKNSASEVEIIRYQVLIPVTEVQVRASSMKDMDNHFLWELIHLKSQVQRRSEKVYHLSNSTSDFRNAFLKTIRQIIRESVRNMSIPMNKPGPPSGTGGTGGHEGGNRMVTSTLQSRSAGKKRTSPNQTSSLQRNVPGKTDYDNVESYDNVPETQKHSTGSYLSQRAASDAYQRSSNESYQHKRASSESYQHEKVLSENFQHQRTPLQHQTQQGNTSGSSYDSDQSGHFRTRSKTVPDAMDELSDSTTKSDIGADEVRSEAEDDLVENQRNDGLGHTPNHLSLSTTSTLSTGSTGSQARLIHASNQPANYQPAKSLGSPVWKPRQDFGSSQSIRSGVGSTTSLSSKYSSRAQQQQTAGYKYNKDRLLEVHHSSSANSCYKVTHPVGSIASPDVRRGYCRSSSFINESEDLTWPDLTKIFDDTSLRLSSCRNSPSRLGTRRSMSRTLSYTSLCSVVESSQEDEPKYIAKSRYITEYTMFYNFYESYK